MIRGGFLLSAGVLTLAMGVVSGCGNSDGPAGAVELAPAMVAAVDGFDQEWPHVQTMGSGTAGYAAGSWAYEDYVYDSTAGTSGNSGDLAVLQITLTEDSVRYVAKLNSYIAEDPTLIALAIDTDCNAATGGGEWPNGSAVSTDGWEFLVQAGDIGASVLVLGAPPMPIKSAANHDTNVIEFDVPRSFADPEIRQANGTVTYKHWCYRGLVGLVTDTWSQTTNVLFRNRIFDQGTSSTDENDSADTFQTDKQVTALQSVDFTDFRRDVDFNLIATGATVVPEPPPGNQFFTRIYDTPDFPNALPEGVHQGENTIKSPLYNGRFQPYAIYVPQTYRDDPRPSPMLSLLHGIFSTHRNSGWPLDDGAFWTDVVNANRAIVPLPFGRGEESWYEHVGEVDVLAVIEDVKEHYHIDESRQFLGGASMGGLGALKIAEEHPDLFAGLILSVPPMSDRTQGYAVPQNNDYDLVDLAGSLRNIPLLDFYGELDPIVPPAANSERFCDKLAELAYDHDCWLDESGSHYSYYNPRFAEIKQMIEGHSLVRDPAHVSFRVHPAFRRQVNDAGVGDLLRYDSAYWVHNVVYPPLSTDPIGDCPVVLLNNADLCTFPADPETLQRLIDGSTISTIDVRTYGTGEGDPIPTTIGDDPSLILVRKGTSLSPGPAVEPRNAFDLLVENVVAFDMDLGRMGLTFNKDLTANVSGIGTVRVGLVGTNSKQCSVTLDGTSIDPVLKDNRLEMALSLQETGEPGKLLVSCSN
jgi:pimeloyl-ACP methyl ester carboxylesterase